MAHALTSAVLIVAVLLTLVCLTNGKALPGETEDVEVFDENGFKLEASKFTRVAVADDRALIDKAIDWLPWFGNRNNTSKYGFVARATFIMAVIVVFLIMMCATCCCCCCCGCCGTC